MAVTRAYNDCTERGCQMKTLILLSTLAVMLVAGQYDTVKITPDMSYLYVYHKGKAVKIHRIQDTKNKLTEK